MGHRNGGSILGHIGTKSAKKSLNLLKTAMIVQVILSGMLPVFGGRNQGYRESRRMSINGLVQQLCRPKEEKVGFVELHCCTRGPVIERYPARWWRRGCRLC